MNPSALVLVDFILAVFVLEIFALLALGHVNTMNASAIDLKFLKMINYQTENIPVDFA
ncbi:MAG: hypothetical protein R2880_10820 [Deinococcales bacterium]